MAVVDGGEEAYLGVQVQTRNMVDRAVERAPPSLRRIFPTAVDAAPFVLAGAARAAQPASRAGAAWESEDLAG
jgi:hypothetical protein